MDTGLHVVSSWFISYGFAGFYPDLRTVTRIRTLVKGLRGFWPDRNARAVTNERKVGPAPNQDRRRLRRPRADCSMSPDASRRPRPSLTEPTRATGTANRCHGTATHGIQMFIPRDTGSR
jgi:hypothetical protein